MSARSHVHSPGIQLSPLARQRQGFRLAPLALLLPLAILLTSAPARAVIPVPEHTGFVVDQAGALSSDEQQSLTAGLAGFQQRTGNQLQALLVPTTEGEPIEAFSIRVADAWKLGTAKKDNGVILVVAVNDRKVRIEVGQGLEGDLPDVAASRIIRGAMIPYFQQGQVGAAVTMGLQAIAHALGDDLQGIPAYSVSPQASSRGGAIDPGIWIFLFFFVILPLLMARRRRGLFWMGGGGWGGGGFGGGGFGGGGGGFGGFGGGGGGFSGGGSSGSW